MTAQTYTGTVRYEKLKGRLHIVAPLAMLRVGVLNGSRGPLFYSQDAIAENYQAWNNVPIVLGHPQVNGSYVSASEPGILAKYELGRVFKAQVTNNTLRGEGWFDVLLLMARAPALFALIRNQRKVELSTGLSTKHIPVRGSYNQKPYDLLAVNLRPDHLAVLLETRGACSIDDGCGVNNHANQELCTCGGCS